MELSGYLVGILCVVSVLFVIVMPDRWLQTKMHKRKAGSPEIWTDMCTDTIETQSQSGKNIVVTVRPRKYKTHEMEVAEGSYSVGEGAFVQHRV